MPPGAARFPISLRELERTGANALRLVVVSGQAATILVTWPLWQMREAPPLLPLGPLPISFGPALLVSLALALIWPVRGTVAHWIVLGLAMLADQTREQPQVLSLAWVLVATLGRRTGREIGVLHLCALWFWSGLGKLTSPRFLAHGGAWLATGDPESASGSAVATAAAIAIGMAELALAVLAIVPRTRPVAAWSGAAMHLAVLAFLSPLGRDWNPAVWPWNAVLAVAALVLLRGPAEGIGAIVRRGKAPRLAAAAFVLLPVGFHVGVIDAPFAFQVYNDNTCHAVLLPGNGPPVTVGSLPRLRATLPRVPRVFLAWFHHIGRRGDRMILVDDRPLAGLFGPRERLWNRDEMR